MCKDQHISDIHQNEIVAPAQDEQHHQQEQNEQHQQEQNEQHQQEQNEQHQQEQNEQHQQEQNEQHQHQHEQLGRQVLNIIEKLVKIMEKNNKNHNETNQKIYSEDETKLLLHGLRQFYVKLNEHEKSAKLIDLINKIKFNQMIIFVELARQCTALSKLLNEQNISTVEIHHQISREERLQRCKEFKECKKRILVATDLIGFHMDFAAVNIVFNYDMSEDVDTYLHRVIGASRFGTKGLIITFVANENDAETLNEVQSRWEVKISEVPDEFDVTSYLENH